MRKYLIVLFSIFIIVLTGCKQADEKSNITYTVIFDTDGGSEIEDIEVKDGEFAKRPTIPTKTGYIFAGWYSDEAFETKFRFASYAITEEARLYAKWEIEKYNVTFKTEEGRYDIVQEVEYNNFVTKPDNPKKDKYIFWGWYKDLKTNDEFIFDTDRITEDIILYPMWYFHDPIQKIKNDYHGLNVTTKGVVTYTTPNGFFITDGTSSIHVETGSNNNTNIKAGSIVKLRGKVELSYGATVIYKPIVIIDEEAPVGGYDFSNAQEEEIGIINSRGIKDMDQYGKIARITGEVIKDYYINDTYISKYAIKDESGNIAVIYNCSTLEVKAELEARVGKTISLVIITLDHHLLHEVWRHIAVDGTIVDIN